MGKVSKVMHRCPNQILTLSPSGFHCEIFLFLHIVSAFAYQKVDRRTMHPTLLQTDRPTGLWVIPCTNCAPNSACLWDEAVWYTEQVPGRCIHDKIWSNVESKRLKAYLKDKVLMFVGDSTLRALMTALIESMNGTRNKSMFTHHQMIENNAGFFSLRYAYYPMYWIPRWQQPNVTDHVLALSDPPEPRNEIIIFIGGAQWLKKRHLKQLYNLISTKEFRTKFSSVRVVVKDHSAGFHSPISGLPYHSRERRMLTTRSNMALISTADHYNWSIIHTYWPTWLRLEHFMGQAGCSCHFNQDVKQRVAKGADLTFKTAGHLHDVLYRMMQQSLLYGSPQ